MIVSVRDCDYTMRRGAMDHADDADEGAAREGTMSDGLQAVQVLEGDGQFRLTAALSPGQRSRVTVDVTPGALKISSGSVSRWVPLPDDALLDHAVVRTSDEALSVVMPVKGRRANRHRVYVW
jgi:hypothetical protein